VCAAPVSSRCTWAQPAGPRGYSRPAAIAADRDRYTRYRVIGSRHVLDAWPPRGRSRRGASIDDGVAVGFRLPENKTARYETFDRPLIEKNIRAACPKCTVLYLGMLVIGSIQSGILLLNLASDAQYMITAGVLLVAVTIDSLARRGRKASGRA
jgi:hypothetical protein